MTQPERPQAAPPPDLTRQRLARLALLGISVAALAELALGLAR